MRRAPRIALALALLVAGCASSGATAGELERARAGAGATLDRLHAAASAADEAAYFAQFAPDAVFLGTDPGERWSLAAFRDFAHPYFAAGRGWTYRPVERHVELDAALDVAWFDERLDNDAYGECRGTGVLVRLDGAWRVAQYSLSIPVPNDLAADLVERIRGRAGR